MRNSLLRPRLRAWLNAYVLIPQMDDDYLEQFPIGAINHVGLPESTLPKEV